MWKTMVLAFILTTTVSSFALADAIALDLERDWQTQFYALNGQLANRPWFRRVASQTFHPAALILDTDRDAVDVVLRRTETLLAHLAPRLDPSVHQPFQRKLAALRRRAERSDRTARREMLRQFLDICRLRRAIAFANPLLDFDEIVFLKSKFATLQHCCYQYYGCAAVPGGGVYRLSRSFSDRPRVRDVLEDAQVARGRLAGETLEQGSFMSLSLSYDGSEVFFAYTACDEEAKPRKRDSDSWRPEECWHVFKAAVDGSRLEQLTDGHWNEFDPWPLPNGRLVFMSERRGGFGRCHTAAMPIYTLHSMRTDGTDIVPLSYHETNEWHPSVNNDGMIIYTRWDYVDRGDCIAHHPWITYPDGRDARAIHGNYPVDRKSRPDAEMHMRAIPGSHRYVATATGHHRLAYGSLIMIDPRVEDDGAMAPVRRLTPATPFPESEEQIRDPEQRRQKVYLYGTAWPLSEYTYLCAHAPGGRDTLGIYLIDAFGNRELIFRDPAIHSMHPVPLRPRKTPPVIPHATAVGVPDGGALLVGSGEEIPQTGVVACVNVYHGLKPWPQGAKIKKLRVIQLFPRATYHMDEPMIGFARESLARGVLGTVPVEEDGSVNFIAPAGKALYFQAIDEEGCAVQSMMSSAYVHPGERLTCQGCHEPTNRAPTSPQELVQAFQRPPSRLEPEAEGAYPLSFPRLVQPVLDRYCVACHKENREEEAPPLTSELAGKFGWSRSYVSLQKYAFGLAGKPPDRQPVRTTPGQFGARISPLYRMLRKGHHELELPPEALRRIALWLDCNSNFFGAYHDLGRQRRGELVVSPLE